MHKDRLLCFGAELVFAICEIKSVQVIILNQVEETIIEKYLAKDVLEMIITVFNARLYHSRSRKKQKIIERIKKVIDSDHSPQNRPWFNPSTSELLPESSRYPRFSYNSVLGFNIRHVSKMTRYPSQILRRQLNAIKRKQFPWMLEFSKNAPQIATIQLGEAKNFSLTNDQFTVEDSRLRIPNLGGCGYYLSPSLWPSVPEMLFFIAIFSLSLWLSSLFKNCLNYWKRKDYVNKLYALSYFWLDKVNWTGKLTAHWMTRCHSWFCRFSMTWDAEKELYLEF